MVLGRHAHVEGKGGDKRARRRDGEGKWEEVRTLKWMEKKGSFWVKIAESAMGCAGRGFGKDRVWRRGLDREGREGFLEQGERKREKGGGFEGIYQMEEG